MRLQPSGNSGILIINGFRKYQALIRARTIVGNAIVQQRFEAIRRSVLTQPRDSAELKAKVTK